MESVLRAVGQAASRAADHIEKNSSDPRNDRTEIGAPKIETGYYSSGKMQGFGSDGRTYRPDAPAGGSYSSRMPGYGREDDTRGRGWREERRDYGRGYGGGSSSDYDRGPPRVDAERYTGRDSWGREETRQGSGGSRWQDQRPGGGGGGASRKTPWHAAGYASREAYDRDERMDAGPTNLDYGGFGGFGGFDDGSSRKAPAPADDSGGGDARWRAEWNDDDGPDPAAGGKKLAMKINDGAPPAQPSLPHPTTIRSLGGAAPTGRPRPQAGGAAPAPPPPSASMDLLGLDETPPPASTPSLDPLAAGADLFAPSSSFGAAAAEADLFAAPAAPAPTPAADSLFAPSSSFGAGVAPAAPADPFGGPDLFAQTAPGDLFAAAAAPPAPMAAAGPSARAAELKQQLAAAVAAEDYGAAAELKKALKAQEAADEEAAAAAASGAAQAAQAAAAATARVAELKRQVQAAVAAEDYEQAAALKAEMKKAEAEAAAPPAARPAAAAVPAPAPAPSELMSLAAQVVNLTDITAEKKAAAPAAPASKVPLGALKAASPGAPPAGAMAGHPDLAEINTGFAANCAVGGGGGGGAPRSSRWRCR